MDGKGFKGLPVVSIDGGLKLGAVHDAYLDAGSRSIASFGIHQGGGLLHGVVDPPLVVDSAEIHALGHDALTVDSPSVLREGVHGGRADSLALSDLLKRKVVTEGGTYVGQVVNAVFDPSTLHLATIEVSPGFFRSNKIVPDGLVTSLGGDVVVVSDAVCEPATDVRHATDEGALEGDLMPLT
jgi:uncharacterized protein YrrD